MTGGPSADLREALDADERIRWHSKRDAGVYRLGVYAGVVLLGLFAGALSFLLSSAASSIILGRLSPLLAGSGTLAGLVGAGAFGAWVARREFATVEYAATDRRLVLAGGILSPSFESVSWEDVECSEFRGKRAVSVYERGSSDLQRFVTPGRGDHRLFGIDDPMAAHGAIETARLDVAGPEPTDDGRGVRREELPEPVREELDADETVVWRATPRWGYFRNRFAAGAVVLVPIAWVVSMVLTGVVWPLAFDPLPFGNAVLLSVAVALAAAGALYPTQRQWYRNREYAATDRRLVETRGVLGASGRALALEDVATVSRSGDDLLVFEDGATSTFAGRRHPALAFEGLSDPQAAYRRIRRLVSGERPR